MNNILNQIFDKTSKVKIFCVTFIITFVKSVFLISLLSDVSTLTMFGLSLFFSFMLSGLLSSTIGLYRVSTTFFKLADEIEEMIRNNVGVLDVIDKLKVLDKQSFHKTTGSRVRELIKMAEIKYNVELLRK